MANKIAQTLTSLGANRFDLKYGMGGLSQSAVMTNIELYGNVVVPRVRELMAGPAGAAAQAYVRGSGEPGFREAK